MHRFGVFEFEKLKLGVLYMRTDDELHVALLNLSASESCAFFAESRARQQLRFAMVAENGDCRVMIPPASDGTQMLLEAAEDAQAVSVAELTETLEVAARFALSAEALKPLGVVQEALHTVALHVVMTESWLEELVRFEQRRVTN